MGAGSSSGSAPCASSATRALQRARAGPPAVVVGLRERGSASSPTVPLARASVRAARRARPRARVSEAGAKPSPVRRAAAVGREGEAADGQRTRARGRRRSSPRPPRRRAPASARRRAAKRPGPGLQLDAPRQRRERGAAAVGLLEQEPRLALARREAQTTADGSTSRAAGAMSVASVARPAAASAPHGAAADRAPAAARARRRSGQNGEREPAAERQTRSRCAPARWRSRPCASSRSARTAGPSSRRPRSCRSCP